MAGNKRVATDTCFARSPGPLRNSCISPNFNERERRLFERIVTGKRRLARHASLYWPHDRLSMLFVVNFGQFKLMGGELHEQRVAGFYMAGDWLGLNAIATGEHSFRLTALENSEVCEIPYAALVDIMNVESAIQNHFLQTMSEALNNEFSRSGLFATASLDRRFASFLLKLGDKYARLGFSDKSYRLSMSRGDIGSYLGTTIAGVSRLIQSFNAQGIVSIIDRTVELCDRPYLQALMCGDEQAAKRPAGKISSNA
jgi:CRP/FNR family transcriptional regulator